jgi:protein-S-isoprenylcysteine O-methyltransferase Ste14
LACAIIVAALIVVLVLASLIFVAAAVRTLGQQWSLQARVLEHDELIQRGLTESSAIGFMPACLACSLPIASPTHWLGLLIASVVYCIGTIIRIRSEEKLLREQFGSAYEEYAREVPAFIPLGGTRAHVPKITAIWKSPLLVSIRRPF